MKKLRFTHSETLEILRLYDSRLSATKIAKQFSCDRGTICRILHENGVSIRYGGAGQLKVLLGMTFGKLKVVAQSTTRPGSYWDCVCVCGRTRSVSGQNLIRKRATSCNMCGKAHEDIPLWYWASINRRCVKKQIEITVSIEYINEVLQKQNFKCALSDISIGFSELNKDHNHTTASIDRIDSSKGYVFGNIQWVHKDINKLKTNLPQDYFVELCTKVARANQ